MIISASRRTDIPAFYGEWLIRRLREGTVTVKNPINQKILPPISLTPDSTECIVFWTKNPRNFLPQLRRIDDMGFRYYFQFTLTPYDSLVEKNLDKSSIIETFMALSEYAGKEKVIWRYDPIFLNARYSVNYHLEKYEELCGKLCGYTEKCVISFIDAYPFLRAAFREHNIETVSSGAADILLRGIAAAARPRGVTVASCCEGIDPEKYGIRHNKCVDNELIERLFALSVPYKKDPSQRAACGCTASRDIGAYNTCGHGCVYCYARRGKALAHHDPDSPMLGASGNF